MYLQASRNRFRISAAAVILILIGATVVAASEPSGAAGAGPASWNTLCAGRVGGASTPLVAGANCRLIQAGGLVRRYVVHVPTAVAASRAPAPVVFMFHGSSGSGEQFYAISGWRELADREGVIAVFPTGESYRVLDTGRLSTKWNDFSLACDVSASRPAGWPITAAYPANDDAFVDVMLAALRGTEQVDNARIYASGFSNGSAFAQSLAITHADTFAAIGSWAGQARECLRADGTPVRPIVAPHLQTPPHTAVPLALGIGTRDEKYLAGINEYLAAHGQPTITSIPLNLATVNGAFGQALLAPTLTNNGLAWVPGSAIGVADWAGVAWRSTWPAPQYVTAEWSTPVPCNPTGSSFVFMLLDGVTHHYPNAAPGKPTLIKQSGSVNAAELFWKFFERHTN